MINNAGIGFYGSQTDNFMRFDIIFYMIFLIFFHFVFVCNVFYEILNYLLILMSKCIFLVPYLYYYHLF